MAQKVEVAKVFYVGLECQVSTLIDKPLDSVRLELGNGITFVLA